MTGRAMLAAVLCLAAGADVFAQVDLSMMHGRPLPSPELAAGTITVRVVRETMANNIVGQEVTLTAAGTAHEATTDDSGRAEFTGLPRGAQGRVETVVDGERLVSEPFTVPGAGGVRIALIAGLGRAAADAGPAVEGTVVLGGETRIVAEFQSDILRVFYTLDIVNNEPAPVDTGTPIVIELPERAVAAAMLEDAPETASVDGRTLTIHGPFQPGTTRVPLAFELDYSGSEHTFVQTWPLAVQEWIVGVERVNGLTVSSPQFRATEQRVTDQGAVFVVAAGTPMPAGSSFTMELGSLPAASRVAPTVAVVAALAVIGLGVWLSLGGTSDGGGRAALEARQRTLLGRLEELERAHRTGTVSGDKYAARRERLMRDLESVYAEIERAGGRPQGGGEGIAA